MCQGIWRFAALTLLAASVSAWAGSSSSAATQQSQQDKPEALKPDKDTQKMIAACRLAMAEAKVVRLPGREQPLLQVTFPLYGHDSDFAYVAKALKQSKIPIDLTLKQGKGLTEDGLLQHLDSLPELQALRLEGGRITDKSLAHLANFKQLDTLSVVSDQITNDGLAPLAKLTGLQELTVQGRQISTAGLVHLKELTNLRLLRGQIMFASRRGSDAPPMLLKAARQFEPLDVRLARDTYLEA